MNYLELYGNFKVVIPTKFILIGESRFILFALPGLDIDDSCNVCDLSYPYTIKLCSLMNDFIECEKQRMSLSYVRSSNLFNISYIRYHGFKGYK